MDLIRKAAAGQVPAREVTCLHVEALPPTVRIIKEASCTLVLVVAPVGHTRAVLKAFEGDEAAIYGLARSGALTELGLLEPATRFGSTERHPRERLRRHLANPPVPAATTMFVVAGRTSGILTADLARALESELARSTRLAGSYRVVGQYALPNLSAPMRALVDRWVEELRWLLIDAGLPVLEETAEDPAPPEPLTELRSGYNLQVPPGYEKLPGVRRWQLRVGNVRATAICGPDWTVIQRGATAPVLELPSHQLCLRRKREELVEIGAFRKRPGRPDLWELNCDLQVPSRVNGGRLLAGTNLPGRFWRLVG